MIKTYTFKIKNTMKKLLMGSVALFLFSASIMIFEASCKKDALADGTPTVTNNPATVFQEGKLLSLSVDGTGFTLSNYDGSSSQSIKVTLPAGYSFYNPAATISPDHKTIFFSVANAIEISKITATYTYSCNIDGSNLKKVDNSGNWHVAF